MSLGHCRCQMDTSLQLKMVPALFNLQKMSGQGVQTHPPMVLLAFISNNFLFLDPPFLGKNPYLLLLCEDFL